MKNTWTIAKRDLGSFFNSPIFYVVTTVFLFIYSWMFFQILSAFSEYSMQMAQRPELDLGLNLNDHVISGTLQNIAVVLLMLIPALTMKSFAEEKKSKTMALLLSSPVRGIEIVLGKFTACLIVVAIMLFLSSYSVIALLIFGKPELGPILTGYLGLMLMSGCFISIGVCASSMTDNQIIAAVLTFGFSLFMWIIQWGTQAASPGLAEVLNFLSLVDHLDRFMGGIPNSSDIVYYLSFIGFCLFLTHRILDSRRWR
jgi:ABC-2 type transport system permease protein